MSAPKLNRWDLIQRMPVIRRVIRKGGQYGCGICRQEFRTYDAAYQCLDDCWQEVQRLSPVVVKNVMGVGRMYRCRFCSRDYNTMMVARECAWECKQKQAMAHAQEAQALNAPLPPKKRLARPMPARRVAQSRFKQKPSMEFQESQMEAILNQPLPSIEPERSKPITAAAAPAAKQTGPSVSTTAVQSAPAQDITASARSKASFKDQFYRKGAKYLCRFCNTEYFTKMEVEACFNNHFDANGYEKPA